MNGLSQMHEKVHGQWEKTLFTQHFHSLTESIDLTKPTHNAPGHIVAKWSIYMRQ